MAEGSEQKGRRRLLDRLAGARPGMEAADARAAADHWLDEHPDDEEMRRALGSMASAGEEDPAEGDLEEGSPT